jgi:DNA polymerase-1
MTSPRGEPVGAVFGFTRDMLYILEQKRPDYLFCAFDLPGRTFRQDLYEPYKIQRPEMDVDLVPQIDTIRRVIETLGIPALGCPGYEADDVLATVAREAQRRGGRCVLVTADKDCRQLLTDWVAVYNIRKDEVFDAARLKEEWGIRPEQVIDFQALVGDAVDNVPGVPLIGPKLARQLLEQYGTLEAVLDHACELSGTKRRENLVKFRDQALLSRQLVRLDDQTPVDIDWAAGRAGNIDVPAATALFRELGFRSFGAKAAALRTGGEGETTRQGDKETGRQGDEEASTSGSAPSLLVSLSPCLPVSPPPSPTVHLVDTPELFEAFLAELRQQRRFSLDTETTHIRPRWAELVGVSLAWDETNAWYLPLRGPEGDRHLDPAATLAAVKPILEDRTIEKIGQNLKFDMLVLRSAGIELAGVAFDTMVASYLLEAGARNHNLDELARTYLGREKGKISDLIGTGRNQRRMDEAPIRLVADYAGQDAWLPWLLRPILAGMLAEARLDELFHSLELPLIGVLAELEHNGIKVDVARLGELSRRFGQRMESVEREIQQIVGRPLNLASPKQLQQLLFRELKLPVVRKSPKGDPSTDADVLEELARQHPLPAKILEYRQYAKLKSTYVDALPTMICPATGRVHASFHQAVAATGRLSSSDPNLQNIPVRTKEGREIRSAFVADPEGWLLLAADYSQIELRVLAHYSGDRQLTEAFARDEDIHARVASQVAGVPLAEVTPEMRRAAKAVNFGVIYGQSPFGLARALGIDQEAAAKFINSYFEGYPGILDFLDRALAECRRTGYATTILGRRRAIRGIRERPGRQRNLAERTAINTVIQGSAADLIKRAMVAIHRRLQNGRLSARMLLQIHDELIFEVPAYQLPDLAQLVTEEMVAACALNVPLKVDIKSGPNWGEME